MQHSTTTGTGPSGWLRHPWLAPILFTLSLLLVTAGILLMLLGRGETQASPINAAPVVVAVTGAVNRPGVYTLPPAVRVVGLINAAGGALTGADLGRINLAAPLFDGMSVYIPRVGEAFPASTGAIQVNINIADAVTMERELGLTKKESAAIVAYRTAHGPFAAIEQLLLVPISRTTFNRIQNLVTVGAGGSGVGG